MARPAWKLVSDSVYYEKIVLYNEDPCTGSFQGKKAISFRLPMSQIHHGNLRGMLGAFWTGVNYLYSSKPLRTVFDWGSESDLPLVGIACVQTSRHEQKFGVIETFAAKEKTKGLVFRSQPGSESVMPIRGGLSGDLHYVLIQDTKKKVLECEKTIGESGRHCLEVSIMQTRHKYTDVQP